MIENEINKVLAQMSALAGGMDSPLRPEPAAGQPSFGAVFKQAIDAVNDKQQIAATLAGDFQSGNTATSVAEVMVEIQKASISFQAMTEARNRMVDAYREIMNMSI